MARSLRNNMAGVTKVALVLGGAIAIVVIGVALILLGNKSPKDSTPKLADQQAKDICNKYDKDLCRFITGWKELKKYRVDVTTSAAGQTTKALFESDDKKSRVSYEAAASQPAYEIISIDNNSYTKTADSTWWKQALKPEDGPLTDYKNNFDDPTDADAADTSYHALGKEACGDRQCFKYKVLDPTQPDDIEYLYFDDADYLVRRIRTETQNGGFSEQVFSYNDVNIEVPSPVKDLGPNQYIVPGQNEPVTLPASP